MRRFCVGMIGLWALCLLFMPASANAGLGDSDVALQSVGTCAPADNCYKPGETITVCFQVRNGSFDTEEIEKVEFTFPAAWTLAFNCQAPSGVLQEYPTPPVNPFAFSAF